MVIKLDAVYWSIDKLPGISKKDQDLLTSNGIYTTQDLLAKVKTPQDKYTLANKLQISLKYINKWSALADLARIPTVGCEHCGALLHSGIASVAQLKQTPLSQLHSHLKRLYVGNTRNKDLSPSVGQVKQWIEQAKLLK
ncbi:MAG: DUF4332 domain-containing protein [Xenococcaceae cyanobacterium MO_207.B15]|nr:DUF4332 domain-containing protein [Xenococcaceae cyanobacterium MO_207.B15]MDJ0745725.1 DUF4332 domain-containing protein [Xenococcaceae cyanobacterium MO_167.B27]